MASSPISTTPPAPPSAARCVSSRTPSTRTGMFMWRSTMPLSIRGVTWSTWWWIITLWTLLLCVGTSPPPQRCSKRTKIISSMLLHLPTSPFYSYSPLLKSNKIPDSCLPTRIHNWTTTDRRSPCRARVHQALQTPRSGTW